MTNDDRAKSEEKKAKARRTDATALRMIRTSSVMVRDELERRSGVAARRIGGLERGEQPIEEKDVRALLGGMDLPYEAWGETVEHVERLKWLRVRHVGQQGAVTDGEGAGDGSGLPGWVFDTAGGLDMAAVRRELLRAAKVAGRAKERETYDLTNLLLILLARLYPET